jgi:hypothetical protein
MSDYTLNYMLLSVFATYFLLISIKKRAFVIYFNLYLLVHFNVFNTESRRAVICTAPL